MKLKISLERIVDAYFLMAQENNVFLLFYDGEVDKICEKAWNI